MDQPTRRQSIMETISSESHEYRLFCHVNMHSLGGCCTKSHCLALSETLAGCVVFVPTHHSQEGSRFYPGTPVSQLRRQWIDRVQEVFAEFLSVDTHASMEQRCNELMRCLYHQAECFPSFQQDGKNVPKHLRTNLDALVEGNARHICSNFVLHLTIPSGASSGPAPGAHK